MRASLLALSEHLALYHPRPGYPHAPVPPTKKHKKINMHYLIYTQVLEIFDYLPQQLERKFQLLLRHDTS